jgi:WhiB family redox-sensing transcriptional regulator
VITRETWREQAACAPGRLPLDVRPNDFFPHGRESATIAKSVCAACPVRELCLSDALESGIDDGVFGGLDAAERRNLRRSGAVA